MSILSTESLGHSFHDKWLFKEIFWGLNRGERFALVGLNGAGKSTFMKILAGKIVPSIGKVVTEKGLRVGYLEQDPQFNEQNTISDFIYSISDKQQQLIRRYEKAIEENVDLDLINELTNEISENNAWEYEYQIKTILGRLGIQNLDQQIVTLSGGQKKRLSLAKLLIDDPDVYLLDEPTNHLDIETIEWLESYLTEGNKTILLVTHDRYFLDSVSTKIIELNNGSLYSYNGNYSLFLEKKAEREINEENTFNKNSNLLRKELEWMRRMPKARTTKSKSRIDAFHDLKEKTTKSNNNSKISLSVNAARQGKKILELQSISKSYGDRLIINEFSYTFKKGDKIGLAGRNGLGKTTLLNLITNQQQPDDGTIEVGETTVFGYYKQGGLEFNDGDRVIDVVKEVGDYIKMADGSTLSASQLLQHFLFAPARQYTPVENLSGGEKKRLQLMRILMRNPNFLILDEPTNDLDIDTLNVLEDFLENFPGVLLLVSHDRYLLDKLTEQLFIFEAPGMLKVYAGNYTDYRLELNEKTQSAPLKIKQSDSDIKATEDKKLSFREIKEFETLENEISDLENLIKEKTETLSSTTEVDTLVSLSQEIEFLTATLDTKTERWLELSALC